MSDSKLARPHHDAQPGAMTARSRDEHRRLSIGMACLLIGGFSLALWAAIGELIAHFAR